MIQDIIAYFIIFSAVGALVYNVLHFFHIVGKKKKSSGGCGSCSSMCDLKEFHQLSKGKFNQQDHYRFYL